MIDLVAVLGAAFAGACGALAGTIANSRRRERESAPLEEPICTGYQSEYGSMNTDCESLRSPTCIDGRCSFHCGSTCKCDASNDPELVGRRRS